jgi:2-keto-4-pentenoate hydratase/2-oxohepta-3-ene-1,7-dioic acid hydratase in catechol pathway
MFLVGDEVRIGLANAGRRVDFSRAWEIYRLAGGDAWSEASSSQSLPRAQPFPCLGSLQLMIERDLFNLETFSAVYAFLEAHDLVDELAIRGTTKYALPISRPSKILALGRNYAAHAHEGGLDVPAEPIVFDKVVTSLVAHEGDIVYPRQVGRLDHEIELAVVIGRRAKDVHPQEAWECVAGYTIGNDISARDVQERDLQKGNPWLRSKSFDTFAPMGPYLVPREAVPDAHNLDMVLKVNGETRQQSDTSKMVFKIPEVVAYISEHMTLLPGDIIMTGTPEGISPLVVGDLVEATIAGLGTLRNRVVAGGSDAD